jgi:hypothetical protein
MAAAALLAASPAGAASTVGEQFSTGSGACGSPQADFMMVQTASPGNSYAAPFDGVLTSWSSDTNTWATATLKVVRLGSGTSFTVLGQDGPRPGDGAVNPIRIPVRQGDVLGLYFPPQPGCPGGVPAGSTYSVGKTAGDVPSGPGGFDSVFQSFQISVTAQLEPDADHDGYGDETQDGCPTIGSTHGPCPLPTVLGKTFTPAANTCSAGNTNVATASPGIVHSAPSDGVVTSWSYQAGSDVSGTVKFKALRPMGGLNYKAVGEDAARTPVANKLNTYGVRIPVREGDKIGLRADVPCVSNVSTWQTAFVPGDHPLGSTALYSCCSGRELDVSAIVEADADHDGFGDTTQDKCPTDPATQGTCPVKPPPPTESKACKAARAKLAKAKAKLSKLKKNDAPAKKVKKAKKAVKKAKAKVKKAC